MFTAGVDLAAEPRRTALALIHWVPGTGTTPGAAHLTELQLGVTDSTIVDAAARVHKVGIDCAFGWPMEFVQFVAGRTAVDRPHPEADGGIDWRRTLAYRETDRAVRQRTGRWPLSVSTDRLGLTAMRCAGLLDRIEASGVPVDRAGTARVVEVYPGASLRLWGLHTAGYRTEPAVRAALLKRVLTDAPWLNVGAFAPLMVSSGDAFDAVVAALAARSAASGLADIPPLHLRERARVEGWIALPTGALGELVEG
jgi:hypothetical protein